MGSKRPYPLGDSQPRDHIFDRLPVGMIYDNVHV